MFGNLTAYIAPKSFKLEKFLANSEPYTNIKPWLAKRIRGKLNEVDDEVRRIGDCAEAVAYSSTVVTVKDDELAQNLYVIVTQPDFWDKVSAAEEYFENTFSNLKFFVNEKEQKVLFISYDCSSNFEKQFLKNIFEKLQYLCNMFSTENYKVKVNYVAFFKRCFFNTTSFLSSFFTSIVVEDYVFTHKRLRELVSLFMLKDNGAWNFSRPAAFFINNWYSVVSMLERKQITTNVPGLYVNHIDKYFENTLWPRNICINILKLAYGKTFSSFESFFATYPEPTNNNIGPFRLDENFVYDEQLLLGNINVKEETDEFITYSKALLGRRIIATVIKVKDSSQLTKYTHLLSKCLSEGIIRNICLVPTPDNTTYYLFLSENITDANLDYAISRDSTRLIQLVADKNWCFDFKSGTDTLYCFVVSGDNLYLSPSSITKIDFDSDATLDWRLLVLQIAKAAYLSGSMPDNLYRCSFMKILPCAFAERAIQYIQTGVFEESTNESWGTILKSEYASRIEFLEALKLTDRNYLCFFPEAQSALIATMLTQGYSKNYCHSEEALEFVKNAGLILSDDVLEKLFCSYSDTKEHFLSIDAIIVSPSFTEQGNYKIIGVKWVQHDLNTLDSFISKYGINSRTLYIMICSLLRIGYNYTKQINSGNIGKLLVSPNGNLYLNRNVINVKSNSKGDSISDKKHFNKLVKVFRDKLGENTWSTLDHFTYDELQKAVPALFSELILGAQNLEYCAEHAHYHLPGKLCIECEKIYALIEAPDLGWDETFYVGDFVFNNNAGNTILWSSNSRYKASSTYKEVQLGIKNKLYDKFFFKPIKIGKTEDDEYGVVFNKIDLEKLLPIRDFKNTQRLKVVLVLYKKLLPYILDGTFITSDPDMFSTIAMHQDYKGEILILRIPFMECSAVLDDTEAKTAKIASTKKLFSEFLVNYITEDESLKHEIELKDSCIKQVILDIQNMNFTEEVVRKCLHSFCDVHKIPVAHGHKLCPLCKASGISEEDVVFEQPNYFKQLTSRTAKYEGGEASLYPYGNKEVQKLFKQDVDLVLKSKILGKALEKAPLFRDFNAKHPDIQFVTINKVMYMHNGTVMKLKGFTQNCVDGSFKISCLRDKEFLEKHKYTVNDVIDIFIKVCIGIEFLHSIGGYIGDLNGGNILIKNGVVYFIDLDGMSFDDVKNFVYTDTYIYPPSAKNKNITKDDDWYSLAVQVFYCLTHSHPFRGVCSKREVPENEVKRMEKGLSVLGNHGIKSPSISIGWSFMPNSMVDFFLNTFEGTKRESMRTVLASYQEACPKVKPSKLHFEELKRNHPCNLALSDNTYISQDGFIIWCENRVVELGATDITVKVNGDYFTFLTHSKTVVLNDNYGSCYTFSAIESPSLVYAIANKVFYTSPDCKALYVKEFIANKEVVRTVTRSTNNRVINFLVTNDEKFIFLEEESATRYAVYCNSDRLTGIDLLPSNPSSHIYYDEVTHKYLILVSGNGITNGLAISQTGSYAHFSIPMNVGKCNCFFGNTLYFANQDKLFMYNLSNKTTDPLPNRHVTSNSLIERKGNKFVICTGAETYVYVRS